MSKSSAFHNKMRLQRAVLACRDLSDRAKLVFVALIDCLNCQTGRCNPTHAMLAKALGMIPRTIQRGLQELAQAGWFTRKLTRGAPYYSFAFDRMLKEGHTQFSPPISACPCRTLPGDGDVPASTLR